MSVIDSENFNELTPPALPASWTFDNVAYWASSAAAPSGSPSGGNALQPVNSAARLAYYSGAQDGNGGNASVAAAFVLTAGSQTTWSLFVRGTSVGYQSGNCYEAKCVLATVGGKNAFVLDAWVSGVKTQLASLTESAAVSGPLWYRVTLTANGALITLSVQRLTDGYWLGPGGTYTASPATALSVSDGTVTGQGYAGLWVFPGNGSYVPNADFADDFLFSTLSQSNPNPPVIVRAAYVPRD